MAITYEPIATITANGSSAYADFNSIPSTYTDLIVAAQFRSGNAGTYTDSYVRLATGGGSVDTGNNYSSTRVYAASTGYSTTRYSNSNLIYLVLCTAASSTASVVTNAIMHINNYSNSTSNKGVIIQGGDADQYVTMGSGLWRNTGAITSIQILTNGSFTSGSTFTLYGIKAV